MQLMKQQLESDMEQWTVSKLGKEYVKAVYCHLVYLNYMQSTFIKKLFSSSSLSAIRVVSSVYVRLLIFLPAIMIPVCASSNLAFHMKYSAYKLNKQGDNIQP